MDRPVRYPRLRLVAEHVPDYRDWLVRHARCTAYLDAAERLLARYPEDVLRQACMRIMWEPELPMRCLPKRVAEIAATITPREPEVVERPPLEEQRQVIADLLASIGRPMIGIDGYGVASHGTD